MKCGEKRKDERKMEHFTEIFGCKIRKVRRLLKVNIK